MAGDVKALIFDVFGTVVDWRSSVAKIAGKFAAQNGIPAANWDQFARDWRNRYQPSMERVRSGELPFTKLDTLHRMNLDDIAAQYGFDGLSADKLDQLNLAWHKLSPWPDSVEGLTLLKSKYIIGTHSNGNIALMVNMAKSGGLPWDVILGAEVVQKAKSGHPGAPMGCAPIAHALFGHEMTFSASTPSWPNRDRFILSNGHSCALLYTMLHLAGYKKTLHFAKWSVLENRFTTSLKLPR